MTVFDWLEGVPIPEGQRPFDIVEVRFKRNRKGYYRIGQGRRVQTGDVAVVDANPGEDTTEKFQEINRAYEVLNNPDMKQKYDMFGK